MRILFRRSGLVRPGNDLGSAIQNEIAYYDLRWKCVMDEGGYSLISSVIQPSIVSLIYIIPNNVFVVDCTETICVFGCFNEIKLKTQINSGGFFMIESRNATFE